jgi:NAD(P)-dependent dehydrogenase (short-subunit alcohol dehydrogenase family)
MRQRHRHFIVTGAGTGIGRAIALRLASEGARLGLLARDVSRLESTAEEALASGASAVHVSGCDIRDPGQVRQAVDASAAALGPLHGMVANSGIGGPNAPGGDDRFMELVQTNLVGTYHCLRAAQSHLAEGPGLRSMVVVSSCLARFGVPGYTGYCASKAGLLGLVRALAMELAPEQVQVNAICPGWVETDMAREGLQGLADALSVSYPEAHAEAMKSVPLGYMSQPEDIAGMVAWLLSGDARGMTGQALDMNAGSWMG